ncbi:MAG: hypothetical protein PHO20_01910 [Candidatus Peribacteraceae bacterium]|nr:hypothetical protein [Candidatus Peribacteraceae bacterium]MDD5739499.1 hypothetical protein [Candidatus Peribacteraceae bacterium]
MKSLINLRVTILAIIVVGVIGVALWLKAVSGEDSWLCVNGEWIKHGNPSAAMPQIPCTPATIPASKRSETPPLVPADQPMTSFTSSDFAFSYPDWPVMSKNMILEPERTAIAVSNAGCALVVTVRQLPSNADFQASIEQLLSEQIAQANVRILQKDILKKSSHVEGEFTIENRSIHSDQYGYVTSKNQFYSIVFASEKDTFDAACKPVIAPLVKSVKVK